MSLAIKRQRRYRLLVSGTVFIAIAAGLLTYAILGLWQRHGATNNPQPATQTQPVTHSTAKPDETPPTASCSTYITNKHQPQKIEIRAIDVSAIWFLDILSKI